MNAAHIADRHEAASQLAPRDTTERRKILTAFDMGVESAGEPEGDEVFQIDIKAVGLRRCDAIAHVSHLLSLLIANPGAGTWMVGATKGNAKATLTRIPS